jgi:hypothetical protein
MRLGAEMPTGVKKPSAAPKPKERRQVLVYLDPGLAKDLKIAAVHRETSASAIAGEAIEAWLKQHGLLSGKKGERS